MAIERVFSFAITCDLCGLKSMATVEAESKKRATKKAIESSGYHVEEDFYSPEERHYCKDCERQRRGE